MARKDKHVSETPATQLLRRAGVDFTEHPYDYVDHGGTAESARQLGLPEHAVVKTLVMQDDSGQVVPSCARFPRAHHFLTHAVGLDRVWPQTGHAMTSAPR